jgi:hypothetical protein
MAQPPDSSPPVDARSDAARFRATLVRVMTVQVIALFLLWILQRSYSA